MIKSLSYPLSGVPFRRRWLPSLLALSVMVLGAVGSLQAQGFDPTKTPVTKVAVPNGWNGALTPAGIVGDTSGWNFGGTPTGAQHPFWHSLDVENGWIFAATGRGMRVYDARTNPGNPEQAGTFNAGISTVPVWHQNDTKFYLFGIDAPEGYDGVAAVASISGNGMLIFDTRSKTSPRLIYQDDGKEGSQVWSTTFNNTHYAFYAATSDRILVYNLSAALAVTNFNNSLGCLDESPAAIFCRDSTGRPVYVGKIPTQSGVSYLHGAGNYLADSLGALGVEVWRVSDPSSPAKVASFAPPGQSAGIALWQDGSKYYLAVLQVANSAPFPLRVYDVSCITSGCSGTPPLVATYNMSHSVPAAMVFLTFSRGPGGAPFLYVGGEDQFSAGPQREYLLDMSTPSAPVEVTPILSPNGYWGWYYFGSPIVQGGNPKGGFNWVMPRGAKLAGGSDGKTYLYRAAFSLFDVHEFRGSTPTAGFTYTPPNGAGGNVYRGDTIQFTDASSGGPTSWSWVFPDGAPASSAAQNPQVVFNTIGTKTVELQINGNTDPGKAARQSVPVLEPLPAVGGISVVPATPRVCQRVSFAGQSVTGKPPLTYGWEILNVDNTPIATGAGTAFEWNTSGSSAGAYQVRLTVTGPAGGVPKTVPFTLASPEALPSAGSFAPTNDAFNGAIVQFRLAANAAPSASEWMWDFGDGTTPVWTSDPVNGPAPVHTYAAIGTYRVKVSVRNCVEPNGVASAELTVNVTQLINLIASFQAFCLGGPCTFTTTDQVPFFDQSTGASFWDYDWNGDGTFEDVGRTQAVSSHQYTTAGRYRPKLKVRAANGTTTSPTYTLEQEIIITAGQQVTPSITLSANVSAPTVGQSVTFTATASNCTPSGSGWSWDTGGGTGSSNTNTISLSWSSTGSKTVRASNSACGTAQGVRSITVSSGGGGGGGALKAVFAYAPNPVVRNQAVSFDGRASTGNPTTWLWDFGDGSALGTGAQVTHTYTQAGTFTAKLTVSASSSACPPAPFCENTAQQSIVVPTGEVPLSASFNSSICVAELSFVVCRADALTEVTFVDASSGNITSRTWDFGDGETASGTTVQHIYKKAGTYTLTLTVSDGSKSESFSRNIIVTGGPTTEVMLVPFIAKTVEGALVQSSDMYLHNPGAASIDVSLEFRRRGTPETVPPKVTRTIAGYATLFVPDVVKEMFGRQDVTGFLGVKVERGETQPVLVSFNTTFQNDGSEFGQTVPGYLLSNTGAASTTNNKQIQHLVGLSDNSERLAYFGFSNPSAEPVTYKLRFFNNLGQEIGTPSQALVLSRYGAKQYQVKDVRTLFGVKDQDDYRVMVESDKGTILFPFGANLRTASNDPSFVSVGAGAERVFLLGALSTPGANNSLWRSDVVIANTSNQVAIVDLSFTNVGTTAEPTDAVRETLQPGETRRLVDVIGTKWNIRNGVGVLTIDSDVPGDLFPSIQGESYENTNPAKRYGQTLPPLTSRQAAGSNQGQYLVGLRHGEKLHTTFWVFNPGGRQSDCDVVFRALDGRELGRTTMSLAAGKLRQFSQPQFPAGVENGFTVQILVRSGQILAAAQVVNKKTNDPAFVVGETR